MSWKYPVGFKYIDPSGDLECKILRRRVSDDDRYFYIVEKAHPNNKFFECIIMEDILEDEIRRGLPYVEDNSVIEELYFDLDFESVTPKKRGPKPKTVYPTISLRGKLELNEEQRGRLSEWKANRK